MRKLLIIDGSSMLTTCYYGNLPKEVMYAKTPEEKETGYKKILQTSNGEYTNAIYGMLKTVLKIMKEQKPSHMAIVFDKSRNTFRRQIYPEYKGNRSQTMQPLKEQFIAAEKLFADLGIPVFYSSEYEADDYAGSLANKFWSEIPVVLMTKDVDYLQLVSDEKNIRAWMVQPSKEKADKLFEDYMVNEELANLPYKTFEFTEEVVREEYNLPNAKAIIDMKALGGDTSDNIPGVKGIGPESAAKLLMEYGTIEELYSSLEDWGPDIEDFWKENLNLKKGLYKKLTAKDENINYDAKQMAFLSKELATIKCDIPIEKSLNEFKCMLNKDAFKEICQHYEFRLSLDDYISAFKQKDRNYELGL